MRSTLRRRSISVLPTAVNLLTAGAGVVFEIANIRTVAAPLCAGTPTVPASLVSDAGRLADAAEDLFGKTDRDGANHDGSVFAIANTGGVGAPLQWCRRHRAGTDSDRRQRRGPVRHHAIERRWHRVRNRQDRDRRGQTGSMITLAGTAATIDTAPANLGFSGNAIFNGADTLSVTATDTTYGMQATGPVTITMTDTTAPSVAASGPYNAYEL
jgi:hypothetical protein